MNPHLFIVTIIISVNFTICAQQQDFLQPYTGPSTQGIDTSSLQGKIICGYQGWFNCKGDGAGLGWVHWIKSRKQAPGPDNVSVDLWPDVSELKPSERFPTAFKHADGSQAEVFSSYNKTTVLRHFKWMREYGIDGAFVQRFANGLTNVKLSHHKNAVLSHAREGANREGRTYAVMYDLSGLKAGEVSRVKEDWSKLRAKMQITKDPAYLKHKGAPVVVVWGIGFNDKNRPYTLNECRDLVAYLKSDGCTVMLGVPSWWREGKRDAIADPVAHQIFEMADILSPWTVGRYRSPEEATLHGEKVWKPDVEWCAKREMDFMPVVFPGFSWHNLKGDPLGAIPRLKGQFLWAQMVAAKRSNSKMIYVAMFDEVDEGTAIFKCSNRPPLGDGFDFLDLEGLPSDFYLRLTGQGGKMLNNKIPLSNTLP